MPGKPFRTLKKGDKVPKWLFKTENVKNLTFQTNVEVYRRAGKYEIYPIELIKENECLMYCETIKKEEEGKLIGAPTLLSLTPCREKVDP